MATDGGAATVVVSGINIDRVRPVVRVTGVRAGRRTSPPGQLPPAARSTACRG
jgi:hypothetical protein